MYVERTARASLNVDAFISIWLSAGPKIHSVKTAYNIFTSGILS